jgi:hypothetical protein
MDQSGTGGEVKLVYLISLPSGLTRREAELVATKAAPGSPLNLSSARRAEERLRGFGRIVVAKESWPRRRKADGGHEQSPSI